MNAQLPDVDVVLSAAMDIGYESAASQIPLDVHAFKQLDSTSNWLRENREALGAPLAAGRAQVCITDWQQAGIGRRGKRWQTLPGNITFSVMYRTDQSSEQLFGLSLVTGIAVADSLQKSLGLAAKLKWPNDVMLNDRKLGGLLTEVLPMSQNGHLETAPPDFLRGAALNRSAGFDVITGIGVNLRQDDAVNGLGIGAISLSEAGFEISQQERDAFVGTISAALLAAHQLFFKEGWSVFSGSWEERDWLWGKNVLIHHEHCAEQAVARGVNEQGALMVERAGSLSPLYGGNVSVRPIT